VRLELAGGSSIDRAPIKRINSAISTTDYYETISSRWSKLKFHPSGFDYLRITLSVCILLWHSYGFSYGAPAALAVWRSHGGLILELILPMFFALSGFLVSGSLERSQNLRSFLALRIIRIYPALCVEVFISALVLGPFVTSYSAYSYFTSGDFFSYFANTVGWIHYNLPGVFLDNPIPGFVNPSLWTVPHELECYVALAILVPFGFMKSRTISLAVLSVCTAAVFWAQCRSGESAIPFSDINGRILVLCFLAGAIVDRFRDILPYDGKLAFASLVLSMMMLGTDYTVSLAPPLVAYLTVYVGMKNPQRTFIIDTGDYSYGVYLYAAPIQQTVAWAMGGANNWLWTVAIAFPAIMLFAFFSWHVVEKPFLKLKRFVLR
jgi:peptidoglycan/LPS O-acetylase OafA/YrhL